MTGEIPISWSLCKFGDLAKIRNGYAFKSSWFKKSKELEADVPLIRQSQLQGPIADLSDAVYLDASHLETSQAYTITEGDILIGMSGSIGKVCTYKEQGVALQNQRTGKIELHSKIGLNQKFLGLYLSSIERILVEFSKGMGVQNISGKDIEGLSFALPPLNEQQRIVTKIEELFSELDKGIENLKQARSQLGVYRQALLKHAFEGKLTADWRAAHADQLESGEDLRARLRAENSSGKTRKQEAGKTPAVTEQIDTAWLPKEWILSAVSDVGNIETGTTPPTNDQALYGDRLPFFKPTDLEQGINVRAARDYLSETGMDYARILPAGSTLVTCIGATIGKTGLAKLECATNQQINSITPIDSIAPEFVYYQAIGLRFQDQIKTNASSTTLPIINKSKFSRLQLAVCSHTEQIKIVNILDEQFSVIALQEADIDSNLQKSEALRQSILKKAFAGELVPQDPADEPASALLDRIRAERAKPDSASKSKKLRTAKA